MMDLALAQSKYNIQLLTRLAQECSHEKFRAAVQNTLSQSIDLQQTLWQHLHAQDLYTAREATSEEIAYTRRHIADLYMARE
jgi:macrodomain Ter protein organizer (MatP/YcbG family)